MKPLPRWLIHNRHRLVLSALAPVVLAMAIALRPVPAAAHPLGNFTINRYSRLASANDGVRTTYVLDMAEIPTFQEMTELDKDSDGPGKMIVAAYLVGARGTAKHAAFLGLTVTLTHTAGVFALGLVTLYLSHNILPETLYPWLGVASGVLVVGMGVTLAAAHLRAILRRSEPHHQHHEHGHEPHDHEHSHEHGALAHSHDGHTHSHVPPGSDGGVVTRRRLLALGVSGGKYFWDPAPLHPKPLLFGGLAVLLLHRLIARGVGGCAYSPRTVASCPLIAPR